LEDVSVWLFFDRGSPVQNTYIIGSITADRYLTVPGTKLHAMRVFMECLDGRQTLSEIERTMLRDHGLQVDVGAMYRKFRGAGLLADGTAPPAGDIEHMSATVLRLPIDGLLRFLKKISPFAVLLACLGALTIAAAAVLSVLDPRSTRLMAVSAGDQSLATAAGYFLLVAPCSVLLHELSHCFAAARWRVLTGSVRLCLYLGVFPIVALKFAGLYTLPARGRLTVWSAGVFANLSIAAAALVALVTVSPHSPVLEMVLTINWFMTILNLVPLLPTDGYFLLTTLTRDPNVRVRAWDLLRHPFRSRSKRSSWFVLVYLVSTIWFLASTFWHHLLRVVNRRGQFPPWQSLLSLLLLALFVLTIWRMLRRTEESK
jgi:Zn-dependent protease